MDRRALLLSAFALGVPAVLLPAASVQAEDAAVADPKLLYVPLAPLLLPGKEKFTFVKKLKKVQLWL
jgi:hypothetical protein